MKYNVGIYCRLSQEDGNDESQSIKAQKEILLAYVQKQNWSVVDIYADDGYSGTTFNRPEFNRLIRDIELQKINLVLTKDLSRLGRNYIQAGYYTEEYFPLHNVRYIALNDNLDTIDEDSCDFMPLKNIINEWYAKDISKKIRFTLDGKAKNGEPKNTVFPIFGYSYNELFERVPDPETANIVKLIFKKFIEYASSSRVAKYLQEQGIYIPRFYNAVKYGYNRAKILGQPKESHTAWTPNMVRDIIIKEEYLGTYKTAKTKGISFKNKKRRKNENCYVFKDRYQPLIDRKTFEEANEIVRRTRSGSVMVEENAFKGLLYCKDCGKALRLERRKSKTKKYTYRHYCDNKLCKHANSVSKEFLENLIVKEIEAIKNFIIAQPTLFEQYLDKQNCSPCHNLIDVERAIEKVKKGCQIVDKKVAFIIEQRAQEILSEATYCSLMENCKREKIALEKELKNLQTFTNLEIGENIRDTDNILQKLVALSPKSFLKYTFLEKIIGKIHIKGEHINGSKRHRNITISVDYNIPINIIKGL